MWSRRGSNPRANEQSKGFLSRLAFVWFSTQSRPKATNFYAYPRFIFKPASRSRKFYICFSGASCTAAANQGCRETSWFPTLLGIKLNLTLFRVMQPRRSYSRRLKKSKHGIYEQCSNARRAYRSIGSRCQNQIDPVFSIQFAVTFNP